MSTSGSRRNSASSSYVDQLRPGQPAAKRSANDSNAWPCPSEKLKNAVQWIDHTLGLEILKKCIMTVEMKRSISDKLEELNAASLELLTSQAAMTARIDELRNYPSTLVEKFSEMFSASEISQHLITQNPDIFSDAQTSDIVPIFKRGPRDRPTTKWICEVNPGLFNQVTKQSVYLGFDRCRVSRFEEVTQCFKCLRHGHPANKCYEAQQFCAHCSKAGHKIGECPSPTLEPKCAN